ncbi:MAG: hypothetical protein LBH01_07735 [Verrucomicrobiales bacterium]|jgi:hypothetical protein|nr:hypothetical protein [Verrucomicrobiales bacterium]
MKLLRSLHLYLGCLFAPMLLFFAVSGIWQVFRWNDHRSAEGPSILGYLSTIHTGSAFKNPNLPVQTLSSAAMHWFVVLMSVVFIFTIILGIVMACKTGRRKTALLCLLAGLAVPIGLVLFAVASH